MARSKGKPTRDSILAAARERYPNKDFVLIENRQAPTLQEKAEYRRQVEEIRVQVIRLTEELKAEESRIPGDPQKQLREAARLALNLDGAEPSWTQLNEAVEHAEHVAALSEERLTAYRRRRQLHKLLVIYRYRIIERRELAWRDDAGSWARGDTLEELSDMLKPRQ